MQRIHIIDSHTGGEPTRVVTSGAPDLGFGPMEERLARFRADPFVAGFRGALDGKATTAELEHVATLIPDEWLAPAATGSPEQCAAAVHHQLDLGADAVILHGAAPAELAPVVEAYRAQLARA